MFFNASDELQKDDIEGENLATLERLRQSQRQDYLKVSINRIIQPFEVRTGKLIEYIYFFCFGFLRALYPVQCKPQIVS